MKVLVGVLLITAWGIAGAAASDKTPTTAAPKAPVQKAQQAKNECPPCTQKEKGPLTGSYLKRDVCRNGVVTDGPNPLYVIDSQAIQRSGAADLSQVLIRTGFRR